MPATRDLQLVIETLAATRPTAVNLHWALARMQRVLQESAPATRRERAWDEARCGSPKKTRRRTPRLDCRMGCRCCKASGIPAAPSTS
jgi:methylthioribose-1-phosphate isomerase